MGKGAKGRLLAWAALVAALLGAGLWRLDLSYDLGLFLPAPVTDEQRILVERLGESPGSRFVLVAVPDDAARVRGLLQRLEDTPGVERVLSDLAPTPERPPEPLWRHRYLLADMDWSAAGLEATLAERLAELGLGADPAYERLVARDPALVSLDLLEALAPGMDQPWTMADGRRVLVAVTEAPAFRLEDQAQALAGIRRAVEGSFDMGMSGPGGALISGAGVFGVELRDTIRQEATWRSIWASLAIATVLLLVYRRPAILVLAALPLGAGLAAGVAAVALVYGQVHGITLAFGFTLLGVAIDYPLHFLSRARLQAPAAALSATWPTLRLSALSTGLAYAALMAGGAQGMAQLGLFSAAGVIAAATTTRYVLPWLLPPRAPNPTMQQAETDGRAAPRRGYGVVALLAVAAVAVAVLTPARPWWESNLAALSPIPAERLAEQGRLRQATGAPNIRYLVAVRHAERERVLGDSVTVNAALRDAEALGLIEGFGDVTPLLPPETTQVERRDAIPARPALEAALAQATAGGPFSPAAFEGFLDDAEASRDLAPLAPADYVDTPLEGSLGQALYQAPSGAWTALATLRGTPDVAGLERHLQDRAPGALLVDLRSASEDLVNDYRQRTLVVLGAVLVLIAALLTWRVQPARAAWTLGLVLACVGLTAAALRAAAGPLDLYHLTGLLLVAGIGLDYALFLGKEDGRAAGHAVFACMASTVAAFGILATSAIPALHSLGSAVALGSGLCFLAAWLGSRGRISP